MSGVTRGLCRFFEGKLYPIFVGLLVLISHIYAIEYICGPILVLSGILILILCDGTENIIPTMVLFVYLLSRKHSPAPPEKSDFFSSPVSLWMIAALGVLVIVAMIYFFAKNERYRRIKLWGQPVYASLILFAYMLFVTALPTGDELMSNLAFAATETCALVIPFVIFHFGMDPKKKRGERLQFLTPGSESGR